MQDGLIDVLVTWQSNRVTRKGAYSAFDLASRVRQAGGRIEYVADSFLNEANEMSDVMLAWVATKDRMFSEDKQKATLRTHANLRTNKAFIGRAPYGWRIAENGDKYHKRPAIYKPEAAIIREAVNRYLNQGESLAVICDSLPPRTYQGRQVKWYPNTLSDLFRNPMTAGRFYWTFFGERVCVAEYPGIITWTEHEQLVARLDSRAHRAGISPANTWLLTGMLADHDGHPMYGKGPRKPSR